MCMLGQPSTNSYTSTPWSFSSAIVAEWPLLQHCLPRPQASGISPFLSFPTSSLLLLSIAPEATRPFPELCYSSSFSEKRPTPLCPISGFSCCIRLAIVILAFFGADLFLLLCSSFRCPSNTAGKVVFLPSSGRGERRWGK